MPANLTMFVHSGEVKDKTTEAELKQISKLYSDWADDIGDMASFYHHKETASSALSEQYYKQLQSQLVATSKEVSNEVYGIAKGGMYVISDAVVKDAVDWTASLGFNKGDMSIAYSYVPDSVVRSIVTGQVYDSGWSLSKSIWGDNEKTLRDIYGIIAEGRAKQQGVYETAKMLEQYVNPNKALPWVGPTVIGPDGKPTTLRIYKKAVDYNAQRLVRTLNQHAYQQSFVETTKDNPFILKYLWQANGSRACQLCLDRDGTEYEKDKLPLDHPNGMCVMVPVTMDKDEMIQKLADWVNGEDGDFPDVDKFAKGVGYDGKPMTQKEFLAKYGNPDAKYFKNWYNKLDDAGKQAYDKLVAASGEDPAMYFKKYVSNAYDASGKKIGAVKPHQNYFEKNASKLQSNPASAYNNANQYVDLISKHMDATSVDDLAFYSNYKKQAFQNFAKALDMTDEQLIKFLKDPDNVDDFAKFMKGLASKADDVFEKNLSKLPDSLADFVRKHADEVGHSKYETPIKWKNQLSSSALKDLEAVKKELGWTYKKIASSFDDDLYDAIALRRKLASEASGLEKKAFAMKQVSSTDSELAKFLKDNYHKFDLDDWGEKYHWMDKLSDVDKQKAEELVKKMGGYDTGFFDKYIKDAEHTLAKDVYEDVAKEKIAQQKAAEKAAKEAAAKKAAELAEKKAAQEAAKIQAYKDAGVYDDIKAAKKAISLADDDLAKFTAKHADDGVEGVWASGKKAVSDYPQIKQSIDGKKKYYDDWLKKYEQTQGTSAAKYYPESKKQEIEQLKKALEGYEKTGKQYEQLLAQQQAAKKTLADLEAPFKTGGFDADLYDDVKKAEAAARVSTVSKADQLHREYLDKMWDDLTDREKYSLWEYTQGSGGFNRPLSGYQGNWNNYVGEGVPWSTESGNRISIAQMRKAAESKTVDYAQSIADLTTAIDKASLPESVVVVRGSPKSGLQGLIEGSDLFSHDEAIKLANGNISTLKAAIEDQEFQWHSFMSTGITPGTGFSGQVKYEIYLPEGTHALYAEPQSYYGNTSSRSLYQAGSSYSSVGHEAELLIQRGSTFRVTEVSQSGGSLSVKMELVEQPTYFATGAEHTFDGGMTSEVLKR